MIVRLGDNYIDSDEVENFFANWEIRTSIPMDIGHKYLRCGVVRRGGAWPSIEKNEVVIKSER
jgi:hypothetical protein